MNDRLGVIAQRAYSSLETLKASYDIARLAIINGIPGDFVECGVAAGAQCAAMALAIMEKEGWVDAYTGKQRFIDDVRRVHLFDSFTGIPQAGPEDTEYLEAGHKAGLTACSLEAVKRHMAEWGIPDELLVYHPGMFHVTVPTAPQQAIAVLRLDGDLYESTKVCVEHLFPLVSKGGWVIVDDWDLTGARKAVIDHIGHKFGPIYFQGIK